MKPRFPFTLIFFSLLIFSSCNPQAGRMVSKGKNPALFPIVSGSKVGYIDASGQIAIQPAFDEGYSFSASGLARVSDGKLYGYINKEGAYQIDPAFGPGSGDFVNGLARVIATEGPDEWVGKMGFIDEAGNFTIQAFYEDAKDYSEGMAAVKDDGAWGFIDRFGNLTIPFHYEETGNFSEGLARVRRFGKYGFIDKSGKLIVDCQYSNAGDFYQGIAPVLIEYGENDQFWGFIRKDGSTAIEDSEIGISPDNVPLYSEGLLANKDPETKKFGFMNIEGEWLIQPQFEDAFHFSEGLASVKKDGKYGFVNQKGKLSIPFIFDGGGNFVNGLSKINVEGSENMYINLKGQFVFRNRN